MFFFLCSRFTRNLTGSRHSGAYAQLRQDDQLQQKINRQHQYNTQKIHDTITSKNNKLARSSTLFTLIFSHR